MIGVLQDWVGRTEEAEDVLTPALVQRFAAVLDLRGARAAAGDPAPPGIHWCLAMAALPVAGLGEDGHPALGGFLPPVPSGRRMWAGGIIRTLGPMRIGDTIRRTSRVASVEMKEGRSGPLCFVAVDHTYSDGGAAVVSERHDIVYRGGGQAGEGPQQQPSSLPGAETAVTVATTPTLLFRYSALTFNGHRIHYDLPYARDVEGYAGLVVHGPLQATWMLHLARDVLGKVPTYFRFRGVRPLICGDVARIEAMTEASVLRLRVRDSQGETTMLAEAG